MSGITVFILSISGVLWYCSKKNSRKSKPQSVAPLDLLPEPEPEPVPLKARTSLMAYDPPGYTEKNAYLGIEYPFATSSSMDPSLGRTGRSLSVSPFATSTPGIESYVVWLGNDTHPL